MNVEHVLSAQEVEPWVRASLRDGLALGLSHHVVAQLPWSDVRYRVLARRDLTRAELLEFSVGGKVAGAPTADDWLIVALSSSVARGRLLLAEDWRARPTDAFLTQRQLPALFAGEQVYYVVSGQPADDPNWKRISSNAPPTFHMFAVESDAPQPGTQLTEAALQRLASGVRQLVLGVYDGESYLLAELG